MNNQISQSTDEDIFGHKDSMFITRINTCRGFYLYSLLQFYI